MLFESNNDDELAKQAKEVAQKTTDDPVLQKYIEGLNLRVFKMERAIASLTLNFWILFFIIFVFPLFLPRN